MSSLIPLRHTDALLVIDVQNDFCPGGRLAVNEGDQIVPVLNAWIDAAEANQATLAFSRDWHPAGHCSFIEQGGVWPIHCIAESEGAELHPHLHLPDQGRIINKGASLAFDQYSPFDRTDLADWLRQRGASRIWIGGLAQDVCVRQTALDAATHGFETHVILPATRPVNLHAGDGEKALREMRQAGVLLEPSYLY